MREISRDVHLYLFSRRNSDGGRSERIMREVQYLDSFWENRSVITFTLEYRIFFMLITKISGNFYLE